MRQEQPGWPLARGLLPNSLWQSIAFKQGTATMSTPIESSPERAEQKSGLPSSAPDFVEVQWQDEIDNIVPSRGYQMTPMVGLGGSAGSIQALNKFFKAMPSDSGMVFVVVLHLAPT